MESHRKEGSGGACGSSSKPQAAPLDAAGTGRTTTQRQQQKHVKVKHIVTTEVSTDEASFKDVVQSLTGKDSEAARAAVVAGAGGTSGRSNDALAARVVNNDTVARVLPSPAAEEMKWFSRA